MLDIDGINNLDAFIIDNIDKNLMLFFGAKRCSPCNKLKDRLINEANQFYNLLIVYIDIDNPNNDEISDYYNIKMIPSQIFIKIINDEVVIINRVDGYDWIKLITIYNQVTCIN